MPSLGDSHAAAQLRLRCAVVAREPGPALLWGAPGTGKRHLAALLHRAGRMGRPFVRVAAGALRLRSLPQLFDDAGHGTLLVSELEQASGKVQRAFAAAVRARVIGMFPLQARVVTTCNDEPYALCERGQLEPALYEAVAGTLLAVPSLRERPGDQRILAEHFLRHNRAIGYGDLRFSEAALELIDGLALDGNAAQLSSLVTRMGVLRRSGTIEPSDVQAALALEGAPSWRRARAEAMRDFALGYVGEVLGRGPDARGCEELPVALREFVRRWRAGRAQGLGEASSSALGALLSLKE